MDPITATTTVITLATFIKDLIDVGQSIKRSIEKVGNNRRRTRELINDILRVLADLANLTRGDEYTFQVPALLTALGNLQGHLLRVLEGCRRMCPSKPGSGFRRLNQMKGWWNRDDIEAELRRLKERVNDCYVEFTTFSVARTEATTGRMEDRAARIEDTAGRIEDIALQTVNTALRVEQTLIVNGVENRAQLHRLQGMIAGVLLNTQFGHNCMKQTIKTMASDATHQTLESQYLSAQTFSLVDSLQQLAVNNVWSLMRRSMMTFWI
ncbi:hypothetical protein FB451DRAFT_403148 [Mycena latifolia]|nr:hypothetical protein FB451DRAFT_403148 [Mycena latifolia]